jgi:peptidoglycan/xylan/chitin deacetylase (PgdA/CDA1 family)
MIRSTTSSPVSSTNDMAEALAILLVVAIGWFSLRYAWWRQAVPYQYPRILMYHMIAPRRRGAQFNGMRVDPEDFGYQMNWLKEDGWTFVTMNELIRKSHPNKTVAITFDDGFEDNFTVALPILEKADAKATLYLVNKRENNDWSRKKKRHHGSGELMRERKLSDEQVRAMLASGRIELGSHTLTHANLLQLTPEEKQQEITLSKEQLESQFGVPVTSFAYPFGIYDEQDRQCVQDAAYTNAVTTDAGIDQLGRPDPFKLKRIKISGKEGRWAFRLRMRTGHRSLRH